MNVRSGAHVPLELLKGLTKKKSDTWPNKSFPHPCPRNLHFFYISFSRMSWSHCHRWYSWPTYFLGQYSLNIPTNEIQTNYASLCARGQTHRQCLYSVHHHLPIKSSKVVRMRQGMDQARSRQRKRRMLQSILCISTLCLSHFQT